MRLAVMPYLTDKSTSHYAAVRVAGYVSCPIEFINTMAVPRSEDCLNGRSRCSITASLIPKRHNGIPNEHDPAHRRSPLYSGGRWGFNVEGKKEVVATQSRSLNALTLEKMKIKKSL
jgi:hypothetical protein